MDQFTVGLVVVEEVFRLHVEREHPHKVIELVGGRQHVSPEIVDTMPAVLAREVDFGILKPRAEHYQETRIMSDQVARLYSTSHFVPDPLALVAAIGSNPAFRDGRQYAAQWQIGEAFFFLAACYHKGEWYIHVGHSPESWGEEWCFTGVAPIDVYF